MQNLYVSNRIIQYYLCRRKYLLLIVLYVFCTICDNFSPSIFGFDFINAVSFLKLLQILRSADEHHLIKVPVGLILKARDLLPRADRAAYHRVLLIWVKSHGFKSPGGMLSEIPNLMLFQKKSPLKPSTHMIAEFPRNVYKKRDVHCTAL